MTEVLPAPGEAIKFKLNNPACWSSSWISAASRSLAFCTFSIIETFLVIAFSLDNINAVQVKFLAL